MKLKDTCAELPIMGVENFLHSLRSYAKEGDHTEQIIVERLIELSEKCAVSYPKISDYKALVDAVDETHDYLNHGWYHNDKSGRMEPRGNLVVQDDGKIVSCTVL